MARSDAPTQRRQMARHAGLWLGITGVLGLLAMLAYVNLARARDAADYSCLASIHANMQRTGVPQGPAESAAWRMWGEPEVAHLLAGLPNGMDCASDSAAGWRAALRIRTRFTAGGQGEAQLWFSGRPHVASPVGAQVPE